MPSAGVDNPDAGVTQTLHLMEEMSGYLESAENPGDFYQDFLTRLLAATGGLSGALWERTPQGGFELQAQIHLAEFGLDEVLRGWEGLAEILHKAAQKGRPLWIPARGDAESGRSKSSDTNPSSHALLLCPILVDKQAEGLVGIWLQPNSSREARAGIARLAMNFSGFAAAFIHKTQWKALVKQKRLWGQLESFTRQIHASLDPHTVSQLVANEGRRLLECDQVGVALRWGKKTSMEAVSGSLAIDQRSRLVQAMQELCDAVMTWGEKLTYQGTRDAALPPRVLQGLDDYLVHSHSRLLLVLPLRVPGEKDNAGSCVAALLAESHDPAAAVDSLQSRLDVLAGHIATAIGNAVHFQQLPLRWLTRPLLKLKQGICARKGIKTALLAALVLLVVGLFWFVQVPLRMEAQGQLLPRHRQMVFSPLSGKIVEIKAQNGDVVGKGQELLFLEDLETQLQVDQLGLKINLAEKRLALLHEQLNRRLSPEERNTLTWERLSQEYELRKALVERDIVLQGSRSPRRTPVLAPLDGKVVTFDAQEQLLGKLVKPSDPLLRVVRSNGPWEIELQIPEGSIAAIREALESSAQGFLTVDLLLASQPHRTYQGRLYREGLGGETSVKENAVVLPARAQIASTDLIAQLKNLPVGVEVRAKVNCGPQALGYVLFYELWEFIYERLIF
ncbi:MAG: biotin/lipoyl-binding protein [Planctomycetes bacterium]|nr:biotin/lipoyl-binding protein [Planctomycetota bacterium]